MATTSMFCAPNLRPKSPVAACPTVAMICAHSRQCRDVENAPTQREVVRMTYAMIDLYCRSYDRPPAAVTLDIDDTCDVARGSSASSVMSVTPP
jgi:hypothetical protein